MPAMEPTACRQLRTEGAARGSSGSAVGTVLRAQSSARLADDFTFAFERALLYGLAAWTVTFFLVFLLPSVRVKPEAAAVVSE